MLEFDDIQHIVMTRVPRSRVDTHFSHFVSLRRDEPGMAGILDKVASVRQARESIEREQKMGVSGLYVARPSARSE